VLGTILIRHFIGVSYFLHLSYLLSTFYKYNTI
jgi:hypothetical protein